MHVYDETLLMADKVLNIYSAQNSAGHDHGSLMQTLNIKHGTEEAGYLLAALERIKKDELLIPFGHSNHLFKIGSHFLTFKAADGYKGWVERENQKDIIKEAFNDLTKEATQNTIDTGKSVQTLNKILKPTTIMQVVIAFLLLLVTGGTVYISYLTYKYQKTNNDLEKRLKSLEIEQSKRESQIQKPLPLKGKDTVYTIAIKQK